MASGEDRIARWINPVIRSMSAYHVPESAGLIKLDAMENPWTLPDATLREWSDRLQSAAINRYPDPGAHALKHTLARVMAVPAGQSLLLGNGSDEIIQLIMTAIAAPGRVVLTAEPGFVMYGILARTLGLEYAAIPLKEDFSLDTDAMLEAIRSRAPAVVFIASPNNPTGNRFAPDAIRAIIEAAPGLVVIDEAYFIFSGQGVMPWLGQYEHLLVMRTLSKLGLAGLRVGFLAGTPDWLAELEKIRLPYNINVLSQQSADFFLGQYDELERQAACIIEARDALYRDMQALGAFKVFPSDANFLLFRSLTRSAAKVHQSLQAQGILIKNLHGAHPLLDQCLRVTVGRPEENQTFLKALATLD